MQQATVNLLADMGVQPTTLISGLVQAEASQDTTPPKSVISLPAAGTTVKADSTVVIVGTASSAKGSEVAAVEVSTDAGATWHPAAGREKWMYTWTPLVSGKAEILSRAVDDNGNLEVLSGGISLMIEPRSCPCSMWPPSAAPDVTGFPDGRAVELGMKFRTDADGFITGIRFFKSVLNTGQHIGDLWTANGHLLASAVFAKESASGWQQVNFSKPVAVSAGTHYVASYHTSHGNYAVSLERFRSHEFSNPPLHALKTGEDGGNGVYAYGAASTFPHKMYQSSNYWIDVVFDPGKR